VRKIDKTLREVRSWKRKVAAKTKGMTTKEVVAYFNSVKDRLPDPHKRRAA
jgi:hypothetical protein